MAAAHARAFPAPWGAAEFENLLGATGVFGFVIESEQPAGMILCRLVAGEAEVLTLAVAPEFRGRGLARALMAAALGVARQRGAAEAFLEVAVDNAAAIGLYRALGFSQSGLRRAYYDRGPAGRVDALVMRLDLNAASA